MGAALDQMTQHERIAHWAAAKRAYAGTISQLENRDFRKYWVGKLRGTIVSRPDGAWKFDTKAEAIDAARQFRDLARSKLMPSNARNQPPADREAG